MKLPINITLLASWLFLTTVALTAVLITPANANSAEAINPVKPADNELSIQINQQLYNYKFANQALADADPKVKPVAPRLSDVLAPVALTEKWYWPVAALYNSSDNTALLLQQQLLDQLAALQQTHATDTKLHEALSAMTKQVQAWQLASRIFIPIDYDLARAKAKYNPRFTAGQYLLRLATRPSQVTVFGLVAQPGKIMHKNTADVAEYVADLSYLAAADSNTLYIVQPNGAVITTTVAAWQQQRFEAMPGAQLFVPFKSGLFSAKWQQLNQDILMLARHRVL